MPTTASLRWGILGVAKITNRLLPAFAQAGSATLTAIASRDLVRARAAATAAGIPIAHGSYEALLDDPSIDAVYIPLPNTLHTEWAMKAAERGKHILCEKPLTPTVAEADRLVDFCRSRGVTLMDGFMWPHHPRTARLRQFLDHGSIGEVRHVNGAFTFQLEPLDPNNIRLQPALAGGSLLDVGCYPVYGIRWAFAAEPVRVFARGTYQFGVDLTMDGLLEFGDGRRATFDCGFTLPMRQHLEITGTQGVVRVRDMWLPAERASFEVRRGEQGPAEEIVSESSDQIVQMIEHFSRAILNNTAVRPEPEEAVRTLRVLEALARSAREERVIELEQH